MKRFTKKIVSVVVALTMVVGLATTAMGATWGTWIGKQKDSGEYAYEMPDGSVKTSSTGFTAKISPMGWHGVWGFQVFQEKLSVSSGSTYVLKFKAKSTKLNKFIYIKVAKGEKIAFSKWYQLKKGTTVTVNEVFKAANSANQITFGLGGEDGARANEDSAIRYKVFDTQFKGKLNHTQLANQDCNGGDWDANTEISVSDYYFGAPAKKVNFSAKAKGKKKVKVSIKKATGIAKYE